MPDTILSDSNSAPPGTPIVAPTVQPVAAPTPAKTILPVHVDGALYVLMAVAASVVASMSTDEAVKFISPMLLFWIKSMFEAVGAGAGALKMYRSPGYAHYVNGNGKSS